MTQPGTSFADPGGGQPAGGDVSRSVQVNLGADVSRYTSQLGAAQQQTLTLGESVVQLSHQIGNLGKSAGKQLFHFAAADSGFLAAAIADVALEEKQLGTLRAAAAVTGSSMSDMKGQIDEAFASFPVSRGAIVQLTETIANLGVTAPKSVGSMVKTFTKLGAATGEDPNALASSSLQLDRTMGHLDPDSVGKYANALLVVSKNEGVAASGVNDFANAIAPMAKAAGIGQAAVMGISAAFVKAGADGGLAANSFIKIITDISTLSATGSPELGKYSSFVGKTASDFQKQTTTQQATQVFSEVGKGGTPALKFMETLGYGPRETKAIQAVAQSGGLGQAIGEAQGATGNTDKLDSASKAAFSGLANSADMVRNQFTILGDLLGTPLIGVATGLTKGFGVLMGITNSVVKMLGPLPSIFAALAAAVAPIAGLVIGHLGTIGTMALARTVLGPNSAGRVALSAGRAAGTAVAGGMTTAEAMAASAVGQRVAAGGASLRFRVPYEYGMAHPGGGSMAAAGSGVRGAAGFVGRGLLGTATWVTQQNTNMYRDSYTSNPENRSGNRPVPEGMRFRDQFRTGSIRGMAGATRDMVGTGIYATGSMFAATAGGGVRGAGRAAQAAAARAAAEPLTGRAASMAAAGVRAPGAAARVAAQAAGAVLPAAAAVGGVAAKGAGLLARGAGAVLGSPLTMIAGMVAAPLIGSLISAIKEGNKAPDVSGSLTGASKYDVALDKTSTNLARFGNSVTAAADKLAGFANTPIGQLGTVTGADVNATAGKDYKIADPALATVISKAKDEAAAPGGDPDAVKKAVLGYLGSMATQNGPIAGDTFTKYKEDVLHEVGPGGANQVSDIMNTFAAQQGQTNPNTDTSYGTLGRLANKAWKPEYANGKTYGGETAGSITDFTDITGTAVAGIVAGTQGYGAEGKKSQVAQMLNLGGVATAGSDNAGKKKEAYAQYMSDTFGVDPKEFTKQLDIATKGSQSKDNTANENYNLSQGIYTEKQAPALMAKAFLATDQGKAYLTANPGMTEADVIAQATNPGKLPPPEAADTTKQLKASGALGEYAGNNAAFLSASIGDTSNQPAAQFAAATDLAGKATEAAGGDMDQATASLNALTDSMGGASTATGALIAQAAAWNRTLSDLKTPQLTREGQLAKANDRARADAAVADPEGHGGTNPSDENVKTAQASKTAALSEQENYRQFMIGQIIALKAFDVSRKRGIEDYNISVANSNRDFGIQQDRALAAYNLQVSNSEEDFHISQTRSLEDYNTSKLRAQEDYQLQSQRSLEDYQLNVTRQEADHARDLKRQALAASQDIYDPYARIQRKATSDAGTLIYNLTEQNANIEKQVAQIAQLKKMGLSQNSIDTLKLSDPGQAQQTDTLLQSLQQNPNMTGQINELNKTRLKGTTTLTQSPDSMAFRQQTEDYLQQMDRQQIDFRKTQDRASIDYYKTASRSAIDFYKSATRASDDQIKTLKRGAAEFKLTSDNAIKDHNTQMTDMQKALKLSQDRALEDLKTSFTQYSGDFNTIWQQLWDTSTGVIGKNAGEAATLVTAALNQVKRDNPWITGLTPVSAPVKKPTDPGFIGPVTADQGAAQAAAAAAQAAEHKRQYGYAYGGISMTAQTARVSEHGPELHLPLNSRGQDFMAGLIAKSLVQGVTTAFSAPANVASSTSNNNTISFDGADIKITTQDPNDMAKQLAAKAKLARLTSPVRH